jgi:regulator of protease activity HflC (stomatin/prohibitin superfamily)
VLNVGIKDVILAPKVRDLLMKEAEAKRVAQATLIGAREEVAALRALANAARLAAEHPQLMRLRELDAVRAFAQTPGNTVVVGVNGLTPLPTATRPSAGGHEAEGEE